MSARITLLNIRERRQKELQKGEGFPGISTEQYQQLLVIDPPDKLDIVTMMEKWRVKRAKEEERKNTPFQEVLDQWINAGKDTNEQENRRNCIQSLIENGILDIATINGLAITIYQFMNRNRLDLIKNYITKNEVYANGIKKTYQNWYASMWKFMEKFVYGAFSKRRRFMPLKRGVRPLELTEAFQTLEVLEKKALKSAVAMRDLLIIRLLMYSGEGVEIKSVLTLIREDVNFLENSVLINNRKGSTSRGNKKLVRCSYDFMQLLKSYIGRRKLKLFSDNENGPVMQDHINKRLSRISSELGINDVTLKSIQRSLLDILKRNGLE